MGVRYDYVEGSCDYKGLCCNQNGNVPVANYLMHYTPTSLSPGSLTSLTFLEKLDRTCIPREECSSSEVN